MRTHLVALPVLLLGCAPALGGPVSDGSDRPAGEDEAPPEPPRIVYGPAADVLAIAFDGESVYVATGAGVGSTEPMFDVHRLPIDGGPDTVIRHEAGKVIQGLVASPGRVFWTEVDQLDPTDVEPRVTLWSARSGGAAAPVLVLPGAPVYSQVAADGDRFVYSPEPFQAIAQVDAIRGELKPLASVDVGYLFARGAHTVVAAQSHDVLDVGAVATVVRAGSTADFAAVDDTDVFWTAFNGDYGDLDTFQAPLDGSAAPVRLFTGIGACLIDRRSLIIADSAGSLLQVPKGGGAHARLGADVTTRMIFTTETSPYVITGEWTGAPTPSAVVRRFTKRILPD